MRVKFELIAGILGALIFAQGASGQYYNQEARYGLPTGYWGPYHSYHHASTAFEGAANGVANGLDAVGRMEYLQSQAAINNELAAELEQSNWERFVAHQIARKEAKDAKKLERQAAARQNRLAAQAASGQAAEIFAATLRHDGARVAWPVNFNDAESQAALKLLEDAAIRVANGGYLSQTERSTLKRTIAEVNRRVCQQRHNIAASRCTEAYRLLQTIDALFSSAAGNENLASSY